MSDLNEVFTLSFADSEVITVPIDDTLQNSGEAAEAKAVGDALALKADRTELQTAVTVNGQSADAQGAIIVTANETKMSSSDNTTVKEKIEAVDGKTGADIPVDSSQGAQTIKQALQSGATRTADQIAMSANDNTTVKEAIEGVAGDLDTLEETVADLDEKTAADIKYQTGSNETIKQHVDDIDQGLVKSVYGEGPDANGDVSPAYVPLADNLYTENADKVDASFLIRTTGGAISLSDGPAWIQKLQGNRVHNGFTEESIGLTVTPMPRSAPAAITASIDNAAFESAAGEAGTYEFEYEVDEWDVSPATFGITVSNTPVDGDKITVVWDGTADPVMTVTAVARTAPAAITATITRDTWVGKVSSSGTYTFAYSTAWKLSNTEVDMAEYGITITNTPIAGDQIVVVYVKEIRGEIIVATPSAVKATGWNLYDHSKGYAHVVKYSDTYGYCISGAYTSIAFAETPTGTATAITPDAGGLFNVTKDGYIIVTGGNGTDTAIWTTWSDWTGGYSGSWKAYAESAVDISSIMTAYFPYGLLRVGDVRDEIDFVHKQAISRILRTAYSDEARASAEATGRDYEFDEDYIYEVRETEVVNAITVDEEYTVSEHGLEFLAGSTIEAYTEIVYGSNLKDKLKRDVLTISQQTLTSGQKSQARENIGAASAADTAEAIGKILPVITGTTNNSGYAIASGEYFEANGKLYKATASIPTGNAWSSSATELSDHGAVNALNASLSTKPTVQFTGTVTSSSSATITVDSGAVYLLILSHPYGSGCAYIVYGWTGGSGRVTTIAASQNTSVSIDSNRVVTITTSDSNLTYTFLKLSSF